MNDKYLCVAAEAAIACWTGPEGELSRKLQQPKQIITEDFLSRWLGVWMLPRCSPSSLRPALARELEVIRRSVLSAGKQPLGEMVPIIVADLVGNGITRGRQTSMVSKFLFSLKPEVITPYDRLARKSLREGFGARFNDHDYPAYLSAFDEVCDGAVSGALDQLGIVTKFEERFRSANMSRNLFARRTTDKYLMLVGGFRIDRMPRLEPE